ncbi:cobalamin biosynthesis protein CobT [Alphaproteobacteria bacterium]|nr:cobalamin biosynthesis protein CobT [Alphaproteobacteria bacterium]
MIKKSIKTKDNFQKSIESTVKVVAEKKNLQIFFGEESNKSKKDIILPIINTPSSSVDIKKIRGMSDSASLVKKYHNIDLHKKLSPSEEQHKKIFDELENMRCEVLGSFSMPGIKKNISEYLKLELNNLENKEGKVSKEKTINFLLRDFLLKEKLCIKYKEVLDNDYKKYEKFFKNYSKDITPLINNQKKFSAFVIELLETLFNKTKNSSKDKEQTDNNEENSLDKSEEKQENKNVINEEVASEDLIEKSDSKEFDESESIETSDGSDESNTEFLGKPDFNYDIQTDFKYKVYTTKFDNIVNANKLCDINEVIKLRKQLDKQTNKLDSTITILANKLQRKLLAKQKRWWEFDLEEGILDSGKLSRVIVSPESSLSYKKEAEADFKDTIVTLLIDNSGSMRGRPITIAAMSTDILAKTLERCAVKVEVLGFTTKTWKGGRARDYWIKNNKPTNPGRLNELLHIVYKHADHPIRRSKQNFGIMLKEGLLKENIDGEALEWAFKRTLSRSEKRKIIMVISDGAPVDDSTLSSNDGNLLDIHLKNMINTIEKKSNVELTAIGIGHDVSRYYSKAITILDVDDLAEVMSKKLIEMF